MIYTLLDGSVHDERHVDGDVEGQEGQVECSHVVLLLHAHRVISERQREEEAHVEEDFIDELLDVVDDVVHGPDDHIEHDHAKRSVHTQEELNEDVRLGDQDHDCGEDQSSYEEHRRE